MQQDVNITIRDALRFLRRGLWLALLVAVAAAVAAYYSSKSLEPTYQASATILTTESDPTLGALDAPLVMAPRLDPNAYRVAALSDTVVGRALQTLGVADPSQAAIVDFRHDIDVRIENSGSYDSTSSLIYIEASDHTPEVAAAKANALARALEVWDRDRARETLTGYADALQNQLDNFDQQIRSLQASGASEAQIQAQIARAQEWQGQLLQIQAVSDAPLSPLNLIQPATVPLEPASPHPIFNTVLAFLLGLIVTYGLLLLREALDTRLRGVEDLTRVSGLPVLAELPRLPDGVRRLPREAIGYLRTNLLFMTPDAQAKTFLVTSAQQGEGKSSVALSLAESFVLNGYHTLLVDADLRHPVLADAYRLHERNHSSLQACLEQAGGPVRPARVAVTTAQYLDVIPSFHAVSSPAELLSRGFRHCLDLWREEYDVIVIDSAPLLAVADTLSIAPLCSGSVLVVNQQRTDRPQVRAAVELLQRVGVRVLGTVATHVRRESAQAYRYGYGVEGESVAAIGARAGT
ncbi:MAG TPA: polysaccharide biosynthesis tyrosine autokinase, partial [Trueperaceae bacterium]